MLRIVTDTGSDITYLSAKERGMEIVELDIRFEEFPYDHRSDTDFSVFYENLAKAKELPKTSQVTPAQYLDIYNDAREKGDEVLVVTLAGGMSGTYSSATMAKEECGYDGVTVIDSYHAITSQRQITEYAVKLRDEGKSRQEIEKELLELREQIVMIAGLDTLTYLKKGGRVPPAMALIGNALNLKPVVILKQGVITPLAKVRGHSSVKRAILEQFEKDGYDESWPVGFGHTNNPERGQAFMEEAKQKYGIKNCELYPVGGVIGTHAGPGGIVITYKKCAK